MDRARKPSPGAQDEPPAKLQPELQPGAQLTPQLRALYDGVRLGRRRELAKAITLVESSLPQHRQQAVALLDALAPCAGGAFRIAITGAPGAGKSTFIEAFGLHLVQQGLRLAVLAIDPSSTRSGGSILGDKTRMEELGRRPEAFIRPSPSGGASGGVADKTRESLLLCEAAAYDVVIVETVGVGQSETAAADMCDVFVLLHLPNSGDDLQAIKRGVVELADVVVCNKADIDATASQRAMLQMQGALRLLQPQWPNWRPQVLQTSALKNVGVDAFWLTLQEFRRIVSEDGSLAQKRSHQALHWMWRRIDAGLRERFRAHPGVVASLPKVEQGVVNGEVSPGAAAQHLLNMLNRYF
ncbi:methylmalonyl Co-A mutase-associated GTPase MeaB [bacterium]|nr:methylmalonyl Co-A mutase-associated GTPase MeaB [bacterium]